MSFCLECDLAQVPPSDARLRRVGDEFAKRSVGKVVREPKSFFTVRPPPPVIAAPADAAPVSDYRELSFRMDWSGMLRAVTNGSAAVSMLDVGCGIGRWLHAMAHCAALKPDQSLVMDAGDPDAKALAT